MNFLYALENSPFWGDVVLAGGFFFLVALLFAAAVTLEKRIT